jgi:hypothetical protein
VDADGPRLVVQCFDIGMNLLTEASGPLVRASGMSMQWSPGAAGGRAPPTWTTRR